MKDLCPVCNDEIGEIYTCEKCGRNVCLSCYDGELCKVCNRLQEIVVDIRKLQIMFEQIDTINSIDFDKIKWIDYEGDEIIVSKELAEEFKFTGLNNVDFVKTRFWETKLCQ